MTETDLQRQMHDAEHISQLADRIERQAKHIATLRDALYRFDHALVRIAAGPRPDGTYNLSREACERIAKEALGV